MRYIVDHRIAGLRILRKKSAARGGDSLAFVSLSLRAFGNNGGRTPSTSTSEQRCNLLQHARCRLSCSLAQSLDSFASFSSTVVTWSHSQVSIQQIAVLAVLFPTSRCRHLPGTTPQPADEGPSPRSLVSKLSIRLSAFELPLSSHALHGPVNVRARSGYVGFASPFCCPRSEAKGQVGAQHRPVYVLQLAIR